MKINYFSVWNGALPNSQHFFSLVQGAMFFFCLVLAVLGNWEIHIFCFGLRTKCPHSQSTKSVFSTFWEIIARVPIEEALVLLLWLNAGSLVLL